MQVEINGRSTGPGIQWPNGCRAAVMLTFDFEAETLRISNLARQGKEPDERDQGRYGGNEGIWRCLKMLDTYGVKGTFFSPCDPCQRSRNRLSWNHARTAAGQFP